MIWTPAETFYVKVQIVSDCNAASEGLDSIGRLKIGIKRRKKLNNGVEFGLGSSMEML